MQLQVLVNHYKENNEIVKRFLSSLEMQKDVQFEVLLYTDGGIKLDTDFLNQFNLKITYKYLSHVGVCHTRNQLFNDSTAEYVMFCDVDDCFSAFNGLSSLMAAAEENDADIVGSPYQHEFLIDGEYCYDTYHNDIIRLHGKIFRRQYLIDNNISFPDELETSGDMMFLWLAYVLTDKAIWIQNNFYVWKNYTDSVTRGTGPAKTYQYPRTIRCYTLLAYDLIDRNRKDLFDKLIATVLFMLFLDSTSKKWKEKSNNEVIKANIAIKNFLSEFYEYYKTISPLIKKVNFQLMRSYKKEYETSKNFEDIDEWVKEKLQIEEERDVVIIGYGVVGANLKEELNILKPEVYDKYKNIDTRTAEKYKVAFICVDTPKTDNNKCDISEVKNAILSQEAELYVIKSTILPGTTNELIKEMEKHIVFSPEYYGGTQHCNNYKFDYTILGGDKEDCCKVIQLLQKIYDGRHQFKITDSKTAELTKYMENSYLATKVSFCQQFYRIAKEAGIKYEELRELFILDPRVNPSHTFVYEDQPYWDSHCLNKDVPAIAEKYNADFLKSVIEYNELCKMGGK